MLYPPTNLTAEIVNEDDAVISWNAPQQGTPSSYKVYRNDVAVKTTSELTYTDEDLTSGTHRYTVTAVYAEGESSPIGPVTVEVTVSVNENNEVSHVMYSKQYQPYLKWLNSLVRDKIISAEWQGYTVSDILMNFSQGNLGCGYIPYWYINSLVTSLAANKDFANEEEAREALDWSLTIRGDGTHGSAVQEKGKTLYYESIGYYITIPVHMAEYGAYVIDWIDQRITDSAFEGYRLGDEGVHYNVVSADTLGAIKVKIGGEEKYIQLTKKYNSQILPTSMYQTGVNPKVAKELWKLSELSYNCWDILIETDYDNIVGNAIAMAPYIKGWSEIDIDARSWVITYEQQIINAESDAVFNDKMTFLTTEWLNKWTKEVNANVQAWHKNK